MRGIESASNFMGGMVFGAAIVGAAWGYIYASRKEREAWAEYRRARADADQAKINATHVDPAAVGITGQLAAVVIANCDPSFKIPLMDDCSCKTTIHHIAVITETGLAQLLEAQRIVDRQSDA
ncbi:MAG: hypothetical protein AB7G62_01250 [Magnetospirillum sp.]